jgi:hypothetical protein
MEKATAAAPQRCFAAWRRTGISCRGSAQRKDLSKLADLSDPWVGDSYREKMGLVSAVI